jgi:uncharacterized protein (TIGR02594 family)
MSRLAYAILGVCVLSFVAITISTQSASAAKKPKEADAAKAATDKSAKTAKAVVAKTAANKPSKPVVANTAKDKRAKAAIAKPATDKPNKVAVQKPVTEKPKKVVLSRAAKASFAKSEVSSDLLNEANRWIGTNPTGWSRVWCARFMNFVLKRTGYAETGSDAASSFASYGRRVWGPMVGAIAVMSRGKNGGHVGVVTGVAEDGKIIVVSGNHKSTGNGRVVGVGHYPPSRIYSYRMPDRSASNQSSQAIQQTAHSVY